jgi:hypothetical protein
MPNLDTMQREQEADHAALDRAALNRPDVADVDARVHSVAIVLDLVQPAPPAATFRPP